MNGRMKYYREDRLTCSSGVSGVETFPMKVLMFPTLLRRWLSAGGRLKALSKLAFSSTSFTCDEPFVH